MLCGLISPVDCSTQIRTVCFTGQLESDDLYYELEKKTQDVKNEFDFSSYSDGHALHNNTNKCKVLKFKDELSGDIISEFICLKPKMYSITSKG